MNPAVTRSLARATAAAILSIAIGLLVNAALGGFTANGFAIASFGSAFLAMVIIGIVVTVIYVASLFVLRSVEFNEGRAVLRHLIHQVRARRSRSSGSSE
jgi:fatty acid desaturase